MELSRTARIAFILVFILFVQSYATGNILPSFFGIGLLAYILFVKESYKNTIGDHDVEISRNIEKKTYFADDPIRVSIDFYYPFNDSVRLALKDRMPEHSFVLEGDTQFDNMVDMPNGVKYSYELVRTMRGTAQFEGIDTKVSDKRGLFYITRGYDLLSEITYLDSKSNIKRAEALSKGTQRDDVTQDDLTMSSGIERIGIREYQPGDRITDIDWKASSRFMKMLTKLSKSEKYGSLYLLLDTSRSMRASYGNKSKFNHSILLSMQLAKIFLDHDTPTGFVAFDEYNYIDAVYPSTEKNQYRQILDLLDMLPNAFAATYPHAPDYEQSDLDNDSKEFLSKIIPFISGTKRSVRSMLMTSGFYNAMSNIIDQRREKALMIVISDLESQSRSLMNTLKMVAGRGNEVILVTPYSPWYDMSLKDLDIKTAEALYDSYLLKSRNISILKGNGIKVIEETPEDSIGIIYPKIAGEI